MTGPYIIVSQRSWNIDLAARLERKTGRQFIHIGDKDELTEKRLEKIQPELIFFPHWSNRIPATIWKTYESIIFHMTDLPYGRGGSPLQNLIMRGHESTMISALRCVQELDAGPVYLKRPLTLEGTAEEIFCRTDKIIEEMIVEILETTPVPQAQVGEPTFFTRRNSSDGNLFKAKSATELFNMIRMLDAEGYPSAFIEWGDFKVEFKGAEQQADGISATVMIREMMEGVKI